MVVEKACREIGRKGERCRASRLPDSDYCVFHDPEHADAMFQAMLVDGQGAAELGGEDPLRPLFRELLERSKAGLTYVNRFLEAVGSAVRLQEPDEAELAKLRAWVERNAGEPTVLVAKPPLSWSGGGIHDLVVGNCFRSQPVASVSTLAGP